MKTERQIWKVLMQATKDGSVPNGHYGPETCRWATLAEMQRFVLRNRPLLHLDQSGEIDCYFTETEAIIIREEHT